MKKHILLSLVIIYLGTSCGKTSPETPPPQPDPIDDPTIGYPNPIFTGFKYVGQDEYYDKNPLAADEFYSNILPGCYPDPSITRKGDDYYLVNSSFAYNPGLPIFHSTDLVNWTQIGHVLDGPLSPLNLGNVSLNGGIYAPAIKYNPYNDTFYVTTTDVGGGLGNIVLKSKDPKGPWSAPIKVDIQGIDPSLFFDDDGKAYILHNADPDVFLYDRNKNKAIRMREYDLATDKVVGNDKVIVNGGAKIEEEPSWIEGPHIYKKNGIYYLLCAEGGTGANHSAVVFKSTDVWGPYVPSEINPILTQRHLPYARPDKVANAGHADIIQTPSGSYHSVFLAVTPNEVNVSPVGRTTFILPVDWGGDFPVITGGLESIPLKQKLPSGVSYQSGTGNYLPTGNFTFEDNFDKETFDMRWYSIRGHYKAFTKKIDKGLEITPYRANIKETSVPSVMCFRQSHNDYTVNTSILYSPQTEDDLAGLTCFVDEKTNYIFGIVKRQSKYYAVVERTQDGETTLIGKIEVALNDNAISLQIAVKGKDYSFSSTDGTDNKEMHLVGKDDGRFLSPYFTGTSIALYATKKHLPVLF